jgi:hypothetical protein
MAGIQQAHIVVNNRGLLEVVVAPDGRPRRARSGVDRARRNHQTGEGGQEPQNGTRMKPRSGLYEIMRSLLAFQTKSRGPYSPIRSPLRLRENGARRAAALSERGQWLVERRPGALPVERRREPRGRTQAPRPRRRVPARPSKALRRAADDLQHVGGRGLLFKRAFWIAIAAWSADHEDRADAALLPQHRCIEKRSASRRSALSRTVWDKSGSDLSGWCAFPG